MKRIRVLNELRALHRTWRCDGETVGVVPTMGALHQGHLSLVKQAKAACDRVIVTVFVNPKQFNNPEDLAKYPRTEHDDAAKLTPYGVEVLYVPDGDEMYPKGFATNVSISGVSDGLCGATRPGHFDGVATVVSKLLLQTDADQAFFGEKDYQQLQVVKRLVTDLDIRAEIIPCPTVREADGLAMSSRNLRLTETGRAVAHHLQVEMQRMAEGLREGGTSSDLRKGAEARLLDQGFEKLEYLELRSTTDLSLLEQHQGSGRLFAAAWLDGIRLIDNIAV